MPTIVETFMGMSIPTQYRDSNLIMLISGIATKSEIIPVILIVGFHE